MPATKLKLSNEDVELISRCFQGELDPASYHFSEFIGEDTQTGLQVVSLLIGKAHYHLLIDKLPDIE
jgi:hypothetical protein